MSRPDTTTISTAEYLRLLEADYTLDGLRAAGVDNWPGFSEVDWKRIAEQVGDARIGLADRIAEEAHRGQLDKADQPYIDHPRAVAEMLREHGPNAVMAGLLHDVVEDSDVTLDDLRAAGFPPVVVNAVDSVTRRPGELYMDMIRRAAADPLGRLVKLADNIHNTSRLDNLEEPVRSGLARRYARARKILNAAA